MTGVPYAQTPMVVLMDGRLTYGAKVLYAVLDSYGRSKGVCNPSEATLATGMTTGRRPPGAKTNVPTQASVRSVQRYLAELIELGYVIRQRKFDAPSVYYLPLRCGAVPPNMAGTVPPTMTPPRARNGGLSKASFQEEAEGAPSTTAPLRATSSPAPDPLKTAFAEWDENQVIVVSGPRPFRAALAIGKAFDITVLREHHRETYPDLDREPVVMTASIEGGTIDERRQYAWSLPIVQRRGLFYVEQEWVDSSNITDEELREWFHATSLDEPSPQNPALRAEAVSDDVDEWPAWAS